MPSPITSFDNFHPRFVEEIEQRWRDHLTSPNAPLTLQLVTDIQQQLNATEPAGQRPYHLVHAYHMLVCHPNCYYCGRSWGPHTSHNINKRYPTGRPAPDDHTPNICLCCHKCADEKADMTETEFLRRRLHIQESNKPSPPISDSATK